MDDFVDRTPEALQKMTPYLWRWMWTQWNADSLFVWCAREMERGLPVSLLCLRLTTFLVRSSLFFLAGSCTLLGLLSLMLMCYICGKGDIWFNISIMNFFIEKFRLAKSSWLAFCFSRIRFVWYMKVVVSICKYLTMNTTII